MSVSKNRVQSKLFSAPTQDAPLTKFKWVPISTTVATAAAFIVSAKDVTLLAQELPLVNGKQRVPNLNQSSTWDKDNMDISLLTPP